MERKKPTAMALWRLFAGFFKIGLFTIGGGYAMLPFIEKEVVEKLKLIESQEVVDLFAVSNALPGVIAINACTMLGYRVYGLRGAIVGAAGVILPSFLVILGIFYAFTQIKDNVYVARAFTGVRAGVTAMMGVMCYKYIRRSINDWMGIVLAAGGFISVAAFGLNAVFAILAAGVVGALYYGLRRKRT